MTNISINYYNNGDNVIKSTIIDLTKDPESNYYNDFFVDDVKGLITYNNLNIKELIYILSFDIRDSIDESTKLKDVYVKLLRDFIEANKNKFIMVRIGYDDSEEDKAILDHAKKLFIEKYVALNEDGFVNVNSLTNLEFSQTFIYPNDASKEFLENIFRYEASIFLGED
jgi:hypothetical protein